MRTRAFLVIACAVAPALLASCGQSKSAGKAAPAKASLAQTLDAMAPDEQLEYVRKLERETPSDPTLAFHEGNAYYSLGSSLPEEEHTRAVAYYDSAVVAYQRAVDLDSTYSKAYVNMGLAYDAQSRRADARRVLRKAIEVNPNDVLAYCHLGLVEQSFGNYGDAVKLYEQALAIDPNSAQAHYNLGLAFAETKVFKEALVEWEKVIALDPDGELGKTASENVRLLRQYMEEKPK